MRAVEAASVRIDGITNELGERSAAIGGIVDSILRIAEQTNLLALNAAIEAARAGEPGRGFAVVADEVRELAEESRGAAGEIAALVREIEQGIGRAVEAAAESSAQVADGVETVERASAMLERINAASDDVVGRLARIEQRTSTVAGALGDVSEVAETTSAAAEQAPPRATRRATTSAGWPARRATWPAPRPSSTRSPAASARRSRPPGGAQASPAISPLACAGSGGSIAATPLAGGARCAAPSPSASPSAWRSR